MDVPSKSPANMRMALVIIGVGGRTLVVDEVRTIERRGNYLEGQGRLGEVEAIEKIVGWTVSIAERRQTECRLDELQDAAEVVCDVRNISGLGIR
jgi:hypothetical protein